MGKSIIAFSLFLCIFVGACLVVMASPDDKNVIIEDSYNYFSEEEIQYIEKAATQLPETYRYFIIPSLSGSTDIKQTAELLFDIKNFSQDTIFMLVVTDDRKIYITTGDALQKKDLNEDFFNNEINKYFVPTVVSKKDLAHGLVELSKGISKEIPLYLETNKSSLTIPQPLEKNLSVDENKSTSYIKTIILIVLIVVFLVAFWRVVKNHFSKRK